MLNCKKGDMARVVKSDAGNVGVICEVLEFLGEIIYEGDMHFTKNVWHVRFAWPVRQLGMDGVIRPAPDLDGALPDDFLRPIRPGDLDEEITTQEPVGELA
jgi:hypothetical protein